jgi:hypothetical protein
LHPLVSVEYLIQRKHQIFVFQFRRGQVEHDVLVKIRLQLSVFGQRENRRLAVSLAVQRLHHVNVEPPLDQPFFGGDGGDDLAAHAALVKRCHALLAIEQQLLGLCLCRNWSALDGAIGEDHACVDLRLERHQCAHGESARD